MTDVPDTPSLARWWHEPWWARLTLTAITVLAVLLMVWNLARGGDFSFYEASARSMSESWRALLFGTFDPGATVTLDKLSGFAVPQALSIRLFGMSTSALALPQVVEGVVTILACSVVGLRWLGRTGGLVAAAAAATTPIFVSMFGHPMEDGLVTMALAVALVWWQRAALTGRGWPLLLAGLFVGVGFQAKMMQAWFILPALVVGVLLATRGWRRRLGHSALLLSAAMVSSIAWMLVIQFVPTPVRPVVDGSTDDDVFAMVFGYNGIDRLLPNAFPGAVHAGGGPGADPASFLKLLDPQHVTQIGWLYPAALAGIALGLWRWWPRRDPADGEAAGGARRATFGGDRLSRATTVVLVVWLVVGAGVLSFAKMPHTAYLAAIGVQLALLSAVAVTEAIRRARSPRRAERAILPALVLIEGSWAVFLAREGRMPAALLIGMCVLLAAGLAASVRAATAPPSPRIDTGATRARASRRGTAIVLAATATAALLSGPAMFSAQALDPTRDGSGGDAYVGLRPGMPDHAFAVGAPDAWGGSSGLTPQLSQLLAAVRARGADRGGGGDVDGGAPLFVTDTWAVAAPIIDATGSEVLTDGGYSGQAPVLTAPQIDALVAAGRVHLLVVKDRATRADPVLQAEQSRSCSAAGHWVLSSGEDADARSGAQGDAPSGAHGATHSGAQADARSGARGDGGQADGVTLYSCT